nr:substrate-binding domain-containing protein [Paraburkholderia sp. ZP32-5]
MKSSKLKICQALTVVIASMGASAAMAGPLVQGGGSSLVGPLIDGFGAATTSNEIGIFGTSEATLTYYSVDSGAGQTAFLNNLPASFGAGVTGTVDFANSDAALTTAQITGYTRTATDGPLIQIPYLITPVTISLANGPTVTSTTTPQTNPNQLHSIALNDADLCGIFSGNFTNWNQVTNPETGATYGLNSAITVVYRADASGTNELLTRHLAAVCPLLAANTTKAGVTFVDSLALGDSFPGKTVPTSFVGVSNSAGVRHALTSATTALVAYLGPDYTNTFLAPKSAVVTSSGAVQLSVASLQNSAASGAPIVAPTAANASAAVSGGMILTSNPADQTQWGPTSGSAYTALANPTAGYPISGTSQIILSQCYRDATVGQAMYDFLNDHYTDASFISLAQGYGFATLPTVFTTHIVDVFVVGNKAHLNINNSTVCGGKGR